METIVRTTGNMSAGKVNLLPASTEYDRELAARMARGDPEAFEALVERYAPRVHSLARRLLGWSDGAEDVVQDVFLVLLRKGNRFRGEAGIWTYLATITVNRCRSIQRRQAIYRRLLTTFGLRRESTLPIAAPELDGTALSVRNAVSRLPGSYREAVVLHYLEELSVAEVAEILDIRRNTVEVRLSRARKLLEEPLALFASDFGART